MIQSVTIPRKTAEIKAVQLGRQKYVVALLTSIALILGLVMTAISVNALYLMNRFNWNTTIGPVNVSGMTMQEALRKVQGAKEAWMAQATVVRLHGTAYAIDKTDLGLQINVDKSVRFAFASNHTDDEQLSFHNALTSIWTHQSYQLLGKTNPESIEKTVIQSIPLLDDNRFAESSVIVTKNGFKMNLGKEGIVPDIVDLRKQLDSRSASLSNEPADLKVKTQKPAFTEQQLHEAVKKAEKLQRTYLRLTYHYDGFSTDEWTVLLRDHRDWISFRMYASGDSLELTPALIPSKLQAHLSHRIAPYIYMPQENVTVSEENGLPKIIGTARDGYALDLRMSVSAINDSVRVSRNRWNVMTVPLQVKQLKAVVTNPDNRFGLSEIIGVGMTDFFGSPANRKFNISHAAPGFHNILLQPGEEFSFVKTMGQVDSIHGYRKELIIVNGDSTEPQWGGGICQVSSTLYRAVLFAGLEITARSSHSFEVKYYQPAGLDATVFDPAPDFRFRNDLPGNLLIQNYVDEKRTKMYFTLIGRKDGRTVHCEGPTAVAGGIGDDKYAFTWTRTIAKIDGPSTEERFLSIYTNKALVKKHTPAVKPDVILASAN